MDLFGPIEYQGTVNKRQVGKSWGVVFVCTTSAMHIEFVDTYSMDSFLMALRRFMCFRGTPSRFQSDRGEQLVASSQASLLVGFHGGDPMGGQKGDRVDPGAHGRAALQWAGRKDDRADQKADLAKL